MKTTSNRIQDLTSTVAFSILLSLPEAHLLNEMSNEDNCTSATFISRKYDWGTIEYKSTLLLECLFGAKSKNANVALEYAERFEHVLSLIN